jgi:hypothetical protein
VLRHPLQLFRVFNSAGHDGIRIDWPLGLPLRQNLIENFGSIAARVGWRDSDSRLPAGKDRWTENVQRKRGNAADENGENYRDEATANETIAAVTAGSPTPSDNSDTPVLGVRHKLLLPAAARSGSLDRKRSTQNLPQVERHSAKGKPRITQGDSPLSCESS